MRKDKLAGLLPSSRWLPLLLGLLITVLAMTGPSVGDVRAGPDLELSIFVAPLAAYVHTSHDVILPAVPQEKVHRPAYVAWLPSSATAIPPWLPRRPSSRAPPAI